MKRIDSRHNPLVGRFRALAATPDPDGLRLLLDGPHLVHEACSAGLDLEVVAIASSRLAVDVDEARLARSLSASGAHVVEVADRVFEAISPVRSPSGIAAIAVRSPSTPDDVYARPDARLVVAADVQDAGNLGGLIRTAEAGGATGFVACGRSASPFSWKAVRGSMGSVMRIPVLAGPSIDSVITALTAADICTVAAVPRGGDDPDTLDWHPPVAILLGGEGAGLTADVVAACDLRVSIPMAPGVESLNVAAAGAVLVYAARRHRP